MSSKQQFRRIDVNKMDLTRAQSLLGFTGSRWMDTSNGMDPKKTLDKALEVQREKVTLRKEGKLPQPTQKEGRKKEPKLAEAVDDYLVLHEAYQFLLHKYNESVEAKNRARMGEECSSTGGKRDVWKPSFEPGF